MRAVIVFPSVFLCGLWLFCFFACSCFLFLFQRPLCRRTFLSPSAGDKLASCQTKKVRMNRVGPPAKAVPEVVRNWPTSQSGA